jgi:hypothetical protein
MLEHVTLTVHEAFSGIAGSISLACWIFLLVKKSLRRIPVAVPDSFSPGASIDRELPSIVCRRYLHHLLASMDGRRHYQPRRRSLG